MRSPLNLIDSQVIHPPLDVTPPIGAKCPCTLSEVNLFRRESVLEFVLLTDVSSIAMEGGTGELRSCLLENLDRVLAAIDPVMFISNDLRASKPVAVHGRPQCLSDVCLLSRGEYTSGVRGIAILGFVLDPNGIGGDSLVLEPLQRL